MSRPPLIITPGDPKGIGPEIVAKALRKARAPKNVLIVGDPTPLRRWSCPEVPILAPPAAPRSSHRGGWVSGWSIQKAVEIIQSGKGRALVTGPISKDHLNRAGFQYPGHTEFLARLSKTPSVTMCLANPKLRVMLATTHVPLKGVSKALTEDRLLKTINHTESYLRALEGITRPKIAVLGLNPHCGEGGLLGKEELDLIVPTLKKAVKRTKAKLIGPVSADTFFALGAGEVDAVIAMYHDQGLIPVKLLDFGRTVNITLGLPFVRTSVDHGVGFDIAGKGIADERSLEAAIKKALSLTRK